MTFAETCGMCRFWRDRDCRRHPPVVVVEPHLDGSTVTTQFPSTEADDWCGEFHALDRAPE